MLVGQSTFNLVRIHEDFTRITSCSIDLGEGLIDSQLGKDLQTVARIISYSVDPGGSINIQLRKDP